MISLSPLSRQFPLSAGGSAQDISLPSGAVELIDLTAEPRFGIKGPGSSAWLEGCGITLPPVNRIGTHGGLRVLRLGSEDFLVVDGELDTLTSRWNNAASPRGYWSWREEGWAWMRLSGPAVNGVMTRLCALDLRAGRLREDEIAQTRVAQLEAVLVRAGDGFDVFFDIAATAFFARTVILAAKQAAGETTSREKHR
jgi:sarcosine oxidase, subunit gamma